MSPLPSNLTLRNTPPGYRLQAQSVAESDYYPSDEYGRADDTARLDWWSNPADATERIAVFAIVTGILCVIIIVLFLRIRKLRMGPIM
ncbi:hypothetical protein FOQG_03944 [Fusarium oxysporum f. sp. raphani 54005]|uniref:Uncharacterized protein n=2 Tax=Fusarium oxysporum TaxID=5507 RepID=X0CVM8_FUSOX|nr:hypothetical protein FOQG_03944 [Fusarium oxysporum f. sp. raphani 54005]EXM31426.1 hypothetical protein FOTG_04133 [Fusarium oxysporum f. sp. vasinfectum 25433]KAK2672354.1 hypothetical protein RAB80_012433 [Fusarium oxysporum f. sp. vasinfectum]KAK2928381.1 hypothetical protein FoTM2_011243 [Fusarium oxysporum f. sp. vasinfectum]